MKRTMSLVMAFLLVVGTISHANAGATLSLAKPSGGSWEGRIGSSQNVVQLSMSNTTKIRGGQLDVTFSPPGILTLDDVIATGALVSWESTGEDVAPFNANYSSNSARLLFFDYQANSLEASANEAAILSLSFSVSATATENTIVTMSIGGEIVVNDGITTETVAKTNGAFKVTSGCTPGEFTVNAIGGWNMIGLPLDASPALDSYSFLTECTSCTQIAKYDGTSFLGAIDLGGDFVVGEQFLLVPGEGYFVFFEADENVKFEGADFKCTSPDVSYQAGWNMISVPRSELITGLDSYAILAAIPEAEQIAKYDGTSFLGAIDLGGDFIVGEQFPLKPGEGYFLFCSGPGKWTPPVTRSIAQKSEALIATASPMQKDIASVKANLKSELSSIGLESAERTADVVAALQTMPNISDIVVSSPRHNKATVSWLTLGVTSDTRVDYGTSSGALDKNVSNTATAELHRIDVTGLAAFSDYFYKVTSKNGSDVATSSVASFKSAIDLGTVTPWFTAASIKDKTGAAAGSVIVYMKGIKGGVESWTESGLTNATNGSVTLDLKALRNPADGGAFGFATGDQIEIWVDGGSKGILRARRFTVTSAVGAVFNAGNLTLEDRVQAQPVFTLSSSPTLDFGKVVTTMSSAMKVTITNTGNVAGSVTAVSTGNASFTTDFSGPVTLAPSGTKDVMVTFTAGTPGDFTATLSVAGDATAQLALKGTSVAKPNFTLASGSQAAPKGTATFGVALANEVPVAGIEFALETASGLKLQIGNVQTTARATGFSVAPVGPTGKILLIAGPGASIAAGTGDIVNIAVTVDSAACAGNYVLKFAAGSSLSSVPPASANIPHTTSETTFKVLNTPAVWSAADSLSFTVEQNTPNGEQVKTLSLANLAKACQGSDLTVTSLTLSGNEKASFKLSTAGPITIVAGTPADVQVTFKPVHRDAIHKAVITAVTSVGTYQIKLHGDWKVAIELTAFDVISGVGQVSLAWEVGAGSTAIGFNVRRAILGQEPVQVNTDLIQSSTSKYSYTEEVEGDITYEYWLEGLDANGAPVSFGPMTASPTFRPSTFALHQNHPNPFNPSTTIRFDVPKEGRVSVRIYNLSGQLIRTLQDGVASVGTHKVVWDGKDNNGHEVTSGVYFYRLEAANTLSTTKRMTMLK